MKLRFENTMGDLIAFNRYHCDHSLTIRRALRSQRWVVSFCIFLVFALCGIPISVTFHGPIGGYVFAGIGLVLAAVWFVYYPTYCRRTLDANVRRTYSIAANAAAIGWQELEIGDDMLINRYDGGELRTKWSNIDRIESSEDYLMIYLTSSVHVVPLDGSTEGDPFLFREALERRIAVVPETGIQAV